MMYTVIGATKSRAFRVMWALEEMGEPYKHIPAAPRSDEARTYNPSGKIPALVDGDEVLTDSMAILTYLKEEFSASAAQLAARLDGPFLAGNSLTVPDILACHCLNWAVGAGFPRVDEKLFNYGKALRQRPAFQAASAR